MSSGSASDNHSAFVRQKKYGSPNVPNINLSNLAENNAKPAIKRSEESKFRRSNGYDKLASSFKSSGTDFSEERRN